MPALSVKPRMPLFQHQEEHLRLHARAETRALFWEQGTAKTAPTILSAAQLFVDGEIDCILVVTPRGGDRNWANEEIPKHMPLDILPKCKTMVWQGSKYKTQKHKNEFLELIAHKGLAILTIQYASFKPAKQFIWKLLRKRKVFYVLDEASGEGAIKQPGGKRAITIQASGRYAKYKRILDGTPAAEGPFDTFMPIKFLEERFWQRHGMWDFNAFKHHFGKWLERDEAQEQLGWDPGYAKLLEYQNLEELNALLNKIGDRVVKDDCLDLPPKLFSKIHYELDPAARSRYEQLKEEYFIQFEDGAMVTADLAIVRLLRFQQIVCGYIPTDKEPFRMIGKTNQRLGVLEDALAPSTHQNIIWCRFIKDIDQICEMRGKRAVRYDGSLTDDQLERNKRAFQAGDAQDFVANSQMSSTLTLHMAKSVFFYSNNFKLRLRLQAEDRAHRAGLQHSVDYRDLVAWNTVDERLVEALRNKLDISSIITGDVLKEWI